MPEEEKTATKHEVSIALIDQRMSTLEKTIAEKFDTLSNIVQKFIDTADRKLDKELYLEDKRHAQHVAELHEKRIGAVEDWQKGYMLVHDAKKNEKDRILGLTKGTWLFVLQVLTVISIIAAIGAR